MHPHPRHDALLRIIQDLKRDGTIKGFAGIVYRYTSRNYASNRRIMNGVGAMRAGGRWNSIQAFHAVYCSSNPDLANREYLAGYRAAGFPLDKAMPAVGKAIRVRLKYVLDATDPAILQKFEITDANLMNDDWRTAIEENRESLCQALGRTASSRNFRPCSCHRFRPTD